MGVASKKKINIQLLKIMRKEAGLTQAELATRLGVSRETISAIENEKPETVASLSIELIEKWWRVCGKTSSQKIKSQFAQNIVNFFNFEFNNKQ
ncbi:MAG: helix-turn-helix transcriptional regulator [Paraglaciecola sp.]|nr:helix-turn-helix transcriptional regulator [Paraglaciecola sp.]NCT47439.1 helix-turn-helix transcriptional regulator [Paraglaciecola sp.]